MENHSDPRDATSLRMERSWTTCCWLLESRLSFRLTYALKASSAAGACIAKVTPDLWRTLYRIAEERGEHVRLDWGVSVSSASIRLHSQLRSRAHHSHSSNKTLRLLVSQS